jgi:acyl-CoA hydrolase
VNRLLRFLQPGARVFVSTMANESALLQEALAADPERASGVTFCGVQFPGVDQADYLKLHSQARLEAHFMTPALRTGMAQGRAALLPADYRGIARHLLQGPAPDVAIAQLSLPDAQGWCSAGLCADFMPLVWARARRRVAHLNPRLPRTAGSFRVHLSELDEAVEADSPLLPFEEAGSGELEARIGAQVAALVRDGDTLQFGIGSVPMALPQALQGHRQLRLHGGLLSQALPRLWEAGALDRDARITTGVLLGDPRLHDVIRSLPQLWLTDVRTTHGVSSIAALPGLGDSTRFVAINSAVEVDLFGQINAERAGGLLQAGAGGLPAFAEAANTTPGGRLLICLGATAKRGTVSRIVPALGTASLCTLPAHAADAVITEHGTAQLRGLSLEQRAQALIAIAAPEHRAALAAAWDGIRQSL